MLVKATGASSEASGNVRISIVPPRITSYQYPPYVELGDPFTYQITATHNPLSFDAIDLPSGLQLNPTTGLISGTATAAGTFDFQAVAHTKWGDALAPVQIVVLPPRITSYSFPVPVDIGSTFTYQITASNKPTFFATTALPAGLRLDPLTGTISGVAELSGEFEVTLTTRGATGGASGRLRIDIQGFANWDTPLAQVPMRVVGAMIADPARSRLYIAADTGLVIYDTQSLRVLRTIPINTNGSGLCISGDGARLWITGYYDTFIQRIDLNTLTPLPNLQTGQYPRLIEEGPGGKLFITDYQDNGVFQIDGMTGATLARFAQQSALCVLALSPDRSYLYVGEIHPNPSVSKFRLSSTGPPVLSQQIQLNGSDVGQLALTRDGNRLAIVSRPTTEPLPTVVRSTNDLGVVQSTLSSPIAPLGLAWSADGSLAFQTLFDNSRIDVFGVASGKLARTITLPDRAKPLRDNMFLPSIAIDRGNAHVFVAASPDYGPPALFIYPVVPPPGPPTPPKSLLNVSTRLRAQTGDNVLIGGFIVTGAEPKKVILRAVGPSLPVAGKLADPSLQLYGADGKVIAQNDNWNAHRTEVLTTGVPPLDEHESAIVTTLQPGSYTAILRGLGNSTGVALVELYDLEPAKSRIANISTRGRVETGDNVMIGGFIIGGDQPTKVIVRAIGPSLGSRGVAGALSNPTLDLHDGNGTKFASNDDWQSHQAQEIVASAVPPTDLRESAIVRTLAPGNYTAIVRGKNDSAGVALVEVYNLN